MVFDHPKQHYTSTTTTIDCRTAHMVIKEVRDITGKNAKSYYQDGTSGKHRVFVKGDSTSKREAREQACRDAASRAKKSTAAAKSKRAASGPLDAKQERSIAKAAKTRKSKRAAACATGAKKKRSAAELAEFLRRF